jgi:hypothetical protein
VSQTLQLLPGEYSLYITPPVAGVDFTGVPTPSVSYQWKKNGVAIAGQTNLLLTGVGVEQAGGTVDLVDGDVIAIDVILTNPVQVTTKTIAATIDTAQPAPVIDPITIRQLSDGQYQTVASLANTDIGEQVVVASNVGGSIPITPPTLATYQWRRGFAPIAGATSQTYTLQAADADSIIDCVVSATNSGGTTSRTASVIVGTLPAAGFTELVPSDDSRLIYVATDGDDTAAANVHGRGYYLKSDPEIGDDPTNPEGPIYAYQTILESSKRVRGRNWNGTDAPGGIPLNTFVAGTPPYTTPDRNGYPDWVLFRRGQSWVMPEVATQQSSTGFETRPFTGLIGNWQQTQNRFSYQGFGASGRSESEPVVIGAWGPPQDPRPIHDRLGVNGNLRNIAIVSLETGRVEWTGSIEGNTADNLLLEDVKAINLGGTALVVMQNARIRRCIATGSHWPESHNQGLFVTGAQGVTIEECVFDHNGYKDDPNEPRSWRCTTFVSPLEFYQRNDPSTPDTYPYDNQTVELWDVTTNVREAIGTVAPAAAEPIAAKYNDVKYRDVSLLVPDPSVPSNPQRAYIGIGRYNLAGQTYATYHFEVIGVFTRTGPKELKIFNAVTESVDTYQFTIGVGIQPFRTYFSRNMYLSKYDELVLRGNIISRDGGGSSVQMGQGGICERNLFIWNEMALTTSRGSSVSVYDAIVKDNVVLHDDHVLPTGAFSAGLQIMGMDTNVHVADGNVVAHFARTSNGVTSIYARGKNIASGSPQSRLGRAIIQNNSILQETGSPGIVIEPTTHNDSTGKGVVGVLSATVSGNAVASALASAQGDASKPTTYSYGSNTMHATSSQPFRWAWHSNGQKLFTQSPFTDGSFQQWQAAGYDADGTFISDFAAFKAAAGWSAPQRDIVSYMQAVDANYVVNEDVYIDDDASGAKQDVRRRVWEVLSDAAYGTQTMTEATAKLTARRYHAFITFIQRAKQNRKGAWDSRWTAEAVNNYIREGFGKPAVTGAYDARSLADRILDYTT